MEITKMRNPTMFPTVMFMLLAPAVASAQAITTISNGGDARSCSFAAELSVRIATSRDDLVTCNRALEQAALSPRDRAATYVNRGILNAAIGRYQEALNDYNEALELDALPQAWNGKGNLYHLAERYDDAIDAYERSLELNLPQPQVAHYNLGLVYERMNDDEAAARSFRTALELAPEWSLPVEKLQELQQ
jgi:tetratricopeptide (TPR) repeat protein